MRPESTKSDRRVDRTRQLLREALTSAVLEKGYERTTVQDILDRANVGRSTFYSHYKDKDELLVSGFEHLRQTFERYDAEVEAASKRSAGPGKYHPTLAFFQHAAEHHRLYKAIISSKYGNEIVQRYLYKWISHLAGRHIKHLVPPGKKPLVPTEILVHYLVSSFLAILTWWLNHDMPYTAQEIYEIYHRLTLPGLRAALDVSNRQGA